MRATVCKNCIKFFNTTRKEKRRERNIQINFYEVSDTMSNYPMNFLGIFMRHCSIVNIRMNFCSLIPSIIRVVICIFKKLA